VDALSGLGNTRMLARCNFPPVSVVEPAAARQLTTAFAFAYPLVAHLAVARSSVRLTVAAVALLALTALLRSLPRGRLVAWLSVPILIAACWVLVRSSLQVLPLYLPPVLVPAFLAWIFGRTLLPGLPQEWWSLFANLIAYVIVVAFFVVEYAYRRRRFPRQPYRNMLEFMQRLLTGLPGLLGRAQR